MKKQEAVHLAMALFAMLSFASVTLAGLPSDLFDLAVTSEGQNGETIRVFPNHVFNVQATDLTLETGVRISWTGAEELEVFFNVYRDDVMLTGLSSQDSFFVDTTALPLNTYEYSVEMIHLDDQDYHMGRDDGSRGFFRPQQSSGSMYTDTGGVELTWQDRSSIEDGFIIFRDGAPIDSVSVNTTYYYDETSTPLQVHDYCISAYVTDGTSNYVVHSSNQVSSAHNLVSQDQMVYVADGFAGLRFFDFSDPINPVYVGSYVTGNEMTAYAGVLLLENGQLSHVWLDPDPGQVENWGEVETQGEPHDVIYIGEGHYLVADGSAGLALFKDNEAVDEADRVDTPGTAVGVSSHTVSDTTAYGFVADSGNGLVIFDVNLADWFGNMSLASTISEATLGGSAVTAAMDGDNLFVAVDGFGIKVYDISNVGSPVEIGSLSDPSITTAYDLSVGSTRAYLTTDSGLVTLDISDPAYPTFVSNFAHSNTATAPMLLMGSNAVVATPTALNIIHLPSDVTTARDCTQGVQATLGTPSNIQASYGLYLDQTVVSWTDNSSQETGFRIIRDDDSFIDIGPDVTEWIETDMAYIGLATEYEVHVLDQTSQPLLGGSAVGIFGPETLRPPTDITASQQDDYDDRIVLNWTDAPDEDSYSIMRMDVASGNDLVEIATVSAGVTSYDDFIPDEETQYYYNVVARSSLGGYSVEQSTSIIGMRDDILPPVNVVATDGEYETRVRITWENRSEKTSYYRVLRDGVPIQTITGAGTFTEDTGEQYPLIPGTVYTYDVEAVASAGFASGGNVDTGFRTLLAPTNVSAGDALHEDHVLVSWTDNSAAETGYNIYRATVADTTLISSRPIGSTAYLDTTGISGTTYDYQIEAFDNDGPSERNSDDGLRNLNPPSNVSATDGDFEDQVVITWDDESGAETGYTVWRDGTLAFSGPANFTTFTDYGQTLGIEHEYTVASFDAYGISEVSSDTGTATLLPPGSLSVSDNHSDGVILLWTDESTINTGYVITRNGALLTSPAANATSYRDNGAAGDVEYEYCINASHSGSGTNSPSVCGVGVSPGGTIWNNNQGWVTSLEASAGTYDNRVRLEWVDNSTVEERFDIYRDEEFVESVAAGAEFYNDYEALPGHTHLYRVVAIDEQNPTLFGHDTTVGWILPDGAITGRITTQSGAPVDNVTVSLDPAPNQSLLFDGFYGVGFVESFSPGSQFTIEFWMKSSTTSGPQTIFSYTHALDYDGIMIQTSQTTNQVTAVINDTPCRLDSGNLHDGQWHHVALSVNARNTSSVTRLYVDGLQTGTHSATLWSVPQGGAMALGQELMGPVSYSLTDGYNGLLDEVRVWGTQRSQSQIQDNMYRSLGGQEANLIAYYPMDAGAGYGIADMSLSGFDATIGAMPMIWNGGIGVFWTGDASPIEMSTLSDIEGNYALSGLRYGSGTNFKVIPSADDKVFDPAFKTIVLDPQSPVQNEVGFNDITGLSFSGLISYDGTNCLQDAVEIYVDDIFAGNTLADGTYTVSAAPGEHVIEARSGTATFYPENYTITATTNQTGLNFQNTTQYILSGGLGGSCNADIGTLHFRIFTEDGCFETTFEGNTDYSIQLPAREYIVAFESADVSPGPISEADVVNFFTNMGSQRIDLSNEDATLDLLYRAPLSMSITGFPAECAGFTDPETGNVTAPAPILEQLSSYTLTINVFEDYGTSQCPVDSGTVTIYDEVMDVVDTPTVLSVIDGLATYTTTANMPNMNAGRVDAQGNDRSFQKPISFVAEVPGQDPMTQTKWALVTGDRPRTGTFVSATSEEIPLLILRDPPGDESSAFFEEGRTFTYTMSNSSLVEIETGVELAVEAGFEFTAGSMFFSTDADAGVETSLGLTIGASATTENEVVFTVTTTEEFNTATDQVFVGEDADLFLGVAMNLLFAKTDVLTVDGCTIQRSEKVRFGADGAEPFETVYLYTASHIENILIPQLENLGELDPDNVAIFNSYAANWNHHLALKDELRDSALENVLENRSFSSGAGYSFSHESTVERSFGWEVGVNSTLEASTELGFKVAGSGVTATFSASMTFESSFGGSIGNETVVSTGYSLSDNDPGDYFSVDIASDPVFGTPVFRNVSGASSCPHEFMTQPRDSIVVAIEPNIMHNVPLDTPAEFVLSLVNESVSQEAREYQLRSIQASNPGGAVIKVNGTLLDDGLSFFLDPGVTQVATLTVEQGPSQFFYNDLQIQAVAPCEYENWENGGTLAAADTISFSVNFEAACSDVALIQPTSGWIYNMADAVANDDTLSFLIDGFQLETSAPDSIDSVGAQYRLVDTEGWTIIEEIARADIPVYGSNHAQAGDPMSVSIDWALPVGLPDGQYELRAFTRCSNGLGGSIPATGRLDRHSPEVFGSPQPSDNSLALGDEISITFNESIDCSTVSGQTVVMAVAGGGQTISTSLTCNGTTVSISPEIPSLDQLEGETLEATVSGIKDLAGNTLVGTTTWQFAVTRNGFAWVEADIYKSAAYQSPGSILGALVNGSALDIDFNLTNVPIWLNPMPASGTVIAGQTLEISFAIDPSLAEGTHLATLQAVSISPAVSAEIDVRVDIGCQVPDWTVNPADFEHSMTAVISLEVDGSLSDDPNDVVVGFVGNQVRGIAHPELVNEISPPRYLAFMNIYSNMAAGENIRFQVFDADQCHLYNSADNYISFQADQRQGFPEGPFELVAMDVAAPDQQTIALNEGWTMFSLSLVDSLDMSVVTILGDLNPSQNDIIKSRTSYAEFDQELGWQGSLSDLDLRESYSINLNDTGNLVHSGVAVDFDTPLYLIDGWNWIGYPQNIGQAVNAGLGDWSPSNGDLVKTQTSFSEYVSSAGSWVGNLINFAPGVGYKLFVDDAVSSGPLQYAQASSPIAGAGMFTLEPRPEPATLADNKSFGENRPNWEMTVGREFNMTLTAVVDVDDQRVGIAGGVVGAFAGEELRGYSELVYIPQLNRHIAFLMVHSNQVEGETITLRFYDPQQDEILQVEETLAFGADVTGGTLRDPMVLHANTSDAETRPTIFNLAPAFPNPANQSNGTTISWAMPKGAHVSLSVYDVRGRLVKEMVNDVLLSGHHTHYLNTRQMASGVYFYRLVAGDFTQTRKMMVVK